MPVGRVLLALLGGVLAAVGVLGIVALGIAGIGNPEQTFVTTSAGSPAWPGLLVVSTVSITLIVGGVRLLQAQRRGARAAGDSAARAEPWSAADAAEETGTSAAERATARAELTAAANRMRARQGLASLTSEQLEEQARFRWSTIPRVLLYLAAFSMVVVSPVVFGVGVFQLLTGGEEYLTEPWSGNTAITRFDLTMILAIGGVLVMGLGLLILRLLKPKEGSSFGP